MRLRKMKFHLKQALELSTRVTAKLLFLLVLPFSTVLASDAHAESLEHFRTPAKRYGSAYSIKMSIRREGFEYDIPMWVKPDSKESTLDRNQLAELGWIYKDFKVEEAAMSGEVIDPPAFKNLKTEWAYVPEFPKSCCYGIIGQDILRKFEVRFDPNPPAHLEWTRIDPVAPKKTIPTGQLAALFSLRSISAIMHKQKVDLSRTPYEINLEQGTIKFDTPSELPTYALKGPLFHYHFAPPARKIVIDSFSASLNSKAKKAGLKAHSTLTRINLLSVASLSRFEVDEYLMGKRGSKIELVSDQTTTTYDFEKNEFTATQPIQTAPRRN